MGSSRGNCEIIEAKDDGMSTKQRAPLLKKSHNNYLERDINKLFESVNLGASKSLDLMDWRRNASKKPIRGVGSQSPMGIGFSEPVSLKQALRGMCISQAAEMAAVKRQSMPASPRISETGNPVNLNGPQAESTSYSSGIVARCNQDSVFKKAATQSSCSSPGYVECASSEPGSLQLECSGYGREEREEDMCFEEPENISASFNVKNGKKLSPVLNDATPNASKAHNSYENYRSESGKKISSSNKVRQKSKLQNVSSSSSLKSNTAPPLKNNNLDVKKPKKATTATPQEDDRNRKEPGQNPPQLLCQKCQCSMENKSQEPVKGPPSVATVKTNIITSKSTEISQSSKSSICEVSSSTTSLSEDSTLNGSACSSRPHMSKDTKWGAINLVRKKYGFLGLSHFNLLRKLGSGDIGTVYLAELIGTGFLFAIKVMDNEFLAKRKKTARAQTEREILRMLDHPFLPTLYVQFTSDNLSCLVMEFCPGGDLHVLRQKETSRYFSEHAARFYVAEVLLALEYLHMLGIVYRDLKPENILVREDGHIMLTDFDLSLKCSVNPTLIKLSSTSAIEPPRASGPCAGSNCIDPFCSGPSCEVSCFSPKILTASARARKLKAEAANRAQLSLPQLVAEPNEARSNSFVGTHEYLAPEIIKGDGHGSAVDWWTFGVFLYELLFGNTPFRGACNDETLANVVLQRLDFPDGPIVSFQARDLIRGLLVKEPEGRLGWETGAAEIKRHAFFEGLNWALIRCAVPPQIPGVFDVGILRVGSECSGDGEHLEFELF